MPCMNIILDAFVHLEASNIACFSRGCFVEQEMQIFRLDEGRKTTARTF